VAQTLTKLERLQSGIQGLDEITGGGLIAGASYLIQGRPGSGKTILANHIAFNHTGTGGQVLFASLLSEPHDRLLQFLSTLSFFDKSKIGTDIVYISAFDELESEGLDEVTRLLRREIVRNKATLLILDGLMNARSQAETPLNTKRFIAELQVHATFLGCTILFLTSAEIEQSSPELSMVDGVITLAEQSNGVRSLRRIKLSKLRGSAFISGEHEYEISANGITVFPRFEELFQPRTHMQNFSLNQTESGILGLDRVLNGGLHEGSATLVFGPSGCGKTTLGLNFITRATAKEKGLVLGFFETPEQLAVKSEALGLRLRQLIDSEIVRIDWQPTTGFKLDDVALRTLTTVREQRIKRVFVDSLAALARPAMAQGRLVEFVSALVNELRDLGATLYLSWETSGFPGTDLQAPAPELCSVVDNIFMMRFTESSCANSRLSLTVIKNRNGHFDHRANNISIGKGGIAFAGKGHPEVVDPLSNG
jgi:circadian clock protein KaiC